MTDMHADPTDDDSSVVARTGDKRPPLPIRISFGSQAMATTLHLWDEAAGADRVTLERVAAGLRDLSPHGISDHPQREVDGVIARWRAASGSAGDIIDSRTTRNAGDMS
ncbi:hypothetical protein [Nocardia testacea]|uniref:Uncharacterized protein n=1 Tax=Nocardia testacea TaxID=248551 RepID=A0ABW7W147_9NOCA